MAKANIADVRKDYKFDGVRELRKEDLLTDPIEQFNNWFHEALQIDELEANAMFLATSSKDCRPSVRTVLLKNFDEKGFVFYTNYLSRKGNDLKENPYASILFFWKELERQVRIEGITELVTRKESDEYFHRRPLDSQLAASSSLQSSVIENREILEKKFNELKDKYKNTSVPLPEFWGGYRLKPEKIEFWQGRQNRMHDRILYTKHEGNWKIERLSP